MYSLGMSSTNNGTQIGRVVQTYYDRICEATGVISKVGPGLFLSGAPSRSAAPELRRLGVKNVLSVARECHDEWIGYECDLQLAHLGFRDHVAMPPWLAVQAVRTLDAMMRNGPTLVHCGIGVSRSPTVIALWWWATGRTTSHVEGVAKLRRLRPCVAPNAIVDEAVLAAVGRLRKAWTRGREKNRKGGQAAGA